MRLVCEFVVLNVILFVALVAAWDLGFVGAVVEADQSRITFLMVAVFVMTWTWQALFTVSASMNFRDPPLSGDGTVRQFPRHPFRTFAFVSQMLVVLGLIGTFVGFAIAVKGIDSDSVGDVEKAGDMVVILASGLGIAIYTTITGAVLGLWLDVNRRLVLHRIEEFEWRSASR